MADVEVIPLQSGLPPCSKPADLPIPKWNHVAAYLNRKPTVCGGYSPGGNASDACYEYSGGTWWHAPFSLHTARAGAAAAVMPKGGNWVVISGSGGGGRWGID